SRSLTRGLGGLPSTKTPERVKYFQSHLSRRSCDRGQPPKRAYVTKTSPTWDGVVGRSLGARNITSCRVPRCEPFSLLRRDLWHGWHDPLRCEHDVPLSRDAHCRDASLLLGGVGQRGSDARKPSYDAQPLFST